MGPFDFILTLLGVSGTNQDPITACNGTTNPCEALTACQGDDPCAAAWQATYQYYADRQYDMAQWQALMGLAFGYLQYESADRTADLQYDIANRQMVIAEEEYQRYKDVYVECENALAVEVCAEMIPDPDYDIRADRALRDVRKQFSALRNKLDRTRSRYCMADHMRKHCELEKSEALAVIAARDNAYRYAEKRRDYLEERRWSRRVTIMEHGRNVMSGQANTYSSASSLAFNALQAGQENKDNAFGNLLGIGNNLLSSYYNQFFSPNPLGGAGGTGGQSGNGSFQQSGIPNGNAQSGIPG